ncbi:MAG: aminotransferase class III-fold pyridoxal phosphate-dependent enzyme, partial [Mariprofundaceae bacterium]|nr:aminotransferase class III-fold pyridoxal phosphate-dependent enzyme [Mariprofundaceae bacterium]
LTVLDVIEQQDLLDNCRQRGAQLVQGLESLRKKFPMIREVRGAGLLIGAALDENVAASMNIAAADIIAACRAAGLLILPAGPYVLRLLPPLNVSAAEINEALTKLSAAFKGVIA